MTLPDLHPGLPQAVAHEHYLEYADSVKAARAREHAGPDALLKLDEEIARAFRHIAAGRRVIDLDAVLKAGGAKDDGLPALAVVRADARHCYWHARSTWDSQRQKSFLNGGGTFDMDERGSRTRARHIRIAPGTLPAGSVVKSYEPYRAIVPMVPPRHRPVHALSNYHILFEAEWEPVVPKDPALLKRLGPASRMFVVLAMWDLTDVERTAMARFLEDA